MSHQIHRVQDFRLTGPFEMRLVFEDGSQRTIDFASVIGRGIYAPLADAEFFSRAVIDEEAGTLVWPNGADFDPAMLHDWPCFAPEMERLVSSWERSG